jgi:DNA mismatch repair protein MutL
MDELMNDKVSKNIDSVDHRIATMACKSAVKGNSRMSFEEASALIDELMTLDNPFNCPHGRPTIVSFTISEVEKMFKRIVT